jgi:RND family efflux transporter MFP subunit
VSLRSGRRRDPARLYTAGNIRDDASPTVADDQLSRDLASLTIDRTQTAGGRSLRGPLIAVAVLAAVVVIGYFVVYPKLRSALFTSEVRTGEITLVSPAQAQVKLTATGYIVALVSAKVAAKVPGRIAEIFVEEGQPIEQGAKVARLEDIDFKSALATSKALGAAARARVQVARGNLAEVRVAIERETPLVAKGVSARADLENLEARHDSLAAAIRAAQAEVTAADAETHSLEVQLGSYLITSPIAGTVVDKLVEVGEGVSPGFGTPGVVEVVDMNSLVVEVDVPEIQLSKVVVDGPCEIVLDAYPTTRLAGAVKEIGQRVNRSKATVPIKISFSDPPDKRVATDGVVLRVLPEMAARVSFLTEQVSAEALAEPPKLVVPANAIVNRNGVDVVFIVDDGQVRMMTVVVGEPFAGGRQLQSSLPAGTKVVLDPGTGLSDGQKVKESRDGK